MKGTARIYSPGMTTPTVVEFDAPPPLQFLRKAVRGHIELVPYFTRFQNAPCVALCNEHGKLAGLELNVEATRLWWYSAAEAHGIRPRQLGGDTLAGPVVVLTGDQEFLQAL
jgi:hypothetical protein